MLAAMQELRDAGYVQYELSNYALPGFASRHNSTYWQGLPYIGLGASAHSFDGRGRWWNIADVHDYCQRLETGVDAVAEYEDLSSEQSVLELILLGLRQKQGIEFGRWKHLTSTDLVEYCRHQGLDVDDQTAPFARSPNGNLLTQQPSALCLTEQGVLLYDSICERLAAGLS